MRRYGMLAPTFWTRGTGKHLRKHPNAQRLAAYLMSAPTSNMIGLYHIAPPTIAHEVGMTVEEAEGALKALGSPFEGESKSFLAWDPDSEMVFVRTMAYRQLGLDVGERLKPKDKRIPNILKLVKECGNPALLQAFWDEYHNALHLPDPWWGQAPSKGHRRGIEGGTKSIPQEQEQEQEQDPLLSDQQTGQTELGIDEVGTPDPESEKRSQAKEVWVHWLSGWRTKVGRGREPTEKVWLDKIVTRLNTYSVEDLKAACDSQWANPYLMGDNPDRKKYCGPEQVFESNMRVEKRLSQAAKGGDGDPGPNQPVRRLPYLVPDPEPTEEDHAAANEALANMRRDLFSA